MATAVALHTSTVGRKAIVAVSGVVLFGFVVVHLIGNLQLFVGPEALNDYSAVLRANALLLWGTRLLLLAAVLAHIGASISLVGRNSDARPVPYQHRRRDAATSYAARTMAWSGPIVALYIVYHLLHLTVGYGPRFDYHNVYNNVVYSFQEPLIVAVYVVANVLLAIHLFHGAWSWLQTLGASHPRYNKLRRAFAIGLALFVGVGNVFIPTAVFAGLVEPTEERFCYPEIAREPGECEGSEHGAGGEGGAGGAGVTGG
jgi:succinate dehydrogenase / fumarate reductase cytochrome b subunit